MEKDYYYDISLQIFAEPDGTVTYSVIQNFSEHEDDHEVIAYGSVDDPREAVRLAKEAIDVTLG